MFHRITILLVSIVIMVPQLLLAQGVFSTTASPLSAVATGHTEVLGGITLVLTQGTTAPDTLVIDVSPFRITNSAAADIRVTKSAAINLGATSIDTDRSRILIPIVNPAATSGFIRIEGIRVSLAGTGATSVSAKLHWQGSQNILSTTTPLVVVDQIRTGLAADAITDRFTVYNGVVYDAQSTISIREGFTSAFSDSSDFGQTNATQVRIRVTDFPAGLRMIFPASVPSVDSGATLTTLQGGSVELQTDGAREVVYRFNKVSTSDITAESFNVVFTVAVQGPVETLQPTIDVSLYPIGASVPGGAFPSTSIPRYAEENMTVLAGSSKIITKTLYWTGIDNLRENSLFLSNPSSNAANVTLSAFSSAGQLLSGTNIVNSVQISLTANQSTERTLSQWFGLGATNVAAVRVQSTNSALLALGTTRATGLIESTPLVSQPIPSFTVAVNTESTAIHLFNPGTVSVTGTLTLWTEQGTPSGTKTISLAGLASVSQSLQELFGTQINGHVAATFTGPIVAFKSFGTAQTLNILPMQAPSSSSTLFVPYFVSGGGYEAHLNIVNAFDETLTVDIRAFDAQGILLGTGVQVAFPPSQQLSANLATLLSLPAGLVTGYVRITVPQRSKGPFTYYPPLLGEAQIRTATASTVVPVSAYSLTDGFILGSGPRPGSYQGIAILNPNSTATTATLQAVGSSGNVMETTTVTVNPGQVVARVTTEFFTTAIPVGSLIRVMAAEPLVTTSFEGTLGLDQLRYLPALR